MKYKEKKNKNATISFRLYEENKEYIRTIAKEIGISVSDLMEQISTEYIEWWKNEQSNST